MLPWGSRNQSSQDLLNCPKMLHNKPAAPPGVVQSADALPMHQLYLVLKGLPGRLDAQLAQLDSVLKNDVPDLNKLPASRKLDLDSLRKRSQVSYPPL